MEGAMGAQKPKEPRSKQGAKGEKVVGRGEKNDRWRWRGSMKVSLGKFLKKRQVIVDSLESLLG
jgi:hypothetical protein